MSVITYQLLTVTMAIAPEVIVMFKVLIMIIMVMMQLTSQSVHVLYAVVTC